MTEMEYNQAEGIRRSDLWKMEDSPEKFKWFLDHPMEQTPALVFGSACHKMILEPETFGDEYAVAPNVDKRTKEGKAIWEAFVADNEGKTIVSMDNAETMRGMEEALENSPLAMKLIRGKGETEQPFFWTDPETGEKCKIKCDRIVTYNRKKYIVDYKTTECAETYRFNSSIWKFGYHFQAAMYAEGWKIANKKRKLPGVLFVAQEKKPPYSVNVIEVSEDVMDAGLAKFHELLSKYHDCKALDVWPGYLVGNVPNDAFVPGWMEREFEDDM